MPVEASNGFLRRPVTRPGAWLLGLCSAIDDEHRDAGGEVNGRAVAEMAETGMKIGLVSGWGENSGEIGNEVRGKMGINI